MTVVLNDGQVIARFPNLDRAVQFALELAAFFPGASVEIRGWPEVNRGDR